MVGFRPPYDWITRSPGAGRGSGGSRVGWVQPTIAVRPMRCRWEWGRRTRPAAVRAPMTRAGVEAAEDGGFCPPCGC